MAITIGFAPNDTTTDANGMVATAGEVTYPITPTDVKNDNIDVQNGTLTATMNSIYGAAASPNRLLIVPDNSGTYQTSTDGINFTSGAIPAFNTSSSSVACFSNGFFYVFKEQSTTYYRAPEDLSSWTTQALPSLPNNFISLAFDNNGRVIVAGEYQQSNVLYSDTGLTGSWVSTNFQTSLACRKMASDGGSTLIAPYLQGGGSSVERSIDNAATWVNVNITGLNTPLATCYFKGSFYVFSNADKSCAYSTDGSSGTWATTLYPSDITVFDAVATNEYMFIIDSDSTFGYVTNDGLNWVKVNYLQANASRQAVVFKDLFVSNTRNATPINLVPVVDVVSLSSDAFAPTDRITSDHNKLDGTISASFNGGELFNDIHTGITVDLKPVFHSDSANTDVTIDKSTITDETFYKFTSPVADHRYHFLNSDSSDSGDGTAANGVDTGTVVYDGKSAQSSGGAINTNYFLCTTTLTPKSAVVAFEKTTDNAGNLDLFSTSSGFGSLLIDTNNAAYTTATGVTVDSGFYLKDMNHIMAVIDSGSTLSLYVDGLKVASTGTYTPSSSTFYDCLRSGLKTWLLEVEGATAITEAQYLDRWNDFVKSGKVAQQYVSHNGKSRVVTVKTTGGDFTTTQAAVDALLEGNETVIVFDGISPTATGLPVNAQIIDLAVEPEPTYYNWKAFV